MQGRNESLQVCNRRCKAATSDCKPAIGNARQERVIASRVRLAQGPPRTGPYGQDLSALITRLPSTVLSRSCCFRCSDESSQRRHQAITISDHQKVVGGWKCGGNRLICNFGSRSQTRLSLLLVRSAPCRMYSSPLSSPSR